VTAAKAWKDIRVGFYSETILPRVINKVMARKEFDPIRARVVAGLDGAVVEIGFGSGLNLPHYPSAVRRVMAVDPSTLGRKLAAERVAALPVPVEFIGLDGENLPLEPDSADHVLVTWTLCSIPQPERALAEVHRVLRAGGKLHFAEHGRSPDPKVARRQDRFTPVQRRVAGGCHLNRPVKDLIEAAELEVVKIDNYYLDGPKAFGYMYEGTALKS
jgi:ubiquinone/menaquinone biosynthesis C-methylase UbiE